jgi:hypothetical protein
MSIKVPSIKFQYIADQDEFVRYIDSPHYKWSATVYTREGVQFPVLSCQSYDPQRPFRTGKSTYFVPTNVKLQLKTLELLQQDEFYTDTQIFKMLENCHQVEVLTS